MCSHKPTIATSIMPRRIEAQQEAVSSWLKLGFDVVSVNIGDEVAHLQQTFPGVRFETVESGIANSPHVPLHEIFASLLKSASAICGIVNSDIVIAAGEDFPAFVEKIAVEGVLFGSRIDYNSDSTLQEEYSLGFDFFFFDKKILADYPKTGFYLGLPTWDYWFSLIAVIRGVPLHRLISPIALHEHHEPSWDVSRLDLYWSMLCKSASSLLREDAHLNENQQRMLGVINCDWRKGSGELRHYLHYATESCFYEYSDHTFETVSIHRGTFEESKSRICCYHDEMLVLTRQIESIRNTGSWRITEPLRRLKSVISGIIKGLKT